MESTRHRIVLIQSDPYLGDTRKQLLERKGYEVVAVHSVDEARVVCRSFYCELVIVDSEQNHQAATELCEEIKDARPGISVAVIAWYDTTPKSDCPDEIIHREGGPKEFLNKVESALANS